jgi:RNA polymerase sigma factor (sigma-70 family)
VDESWLTARFEEHRARVRAVAYRMLGSASEADDVVQEVWLRVSRRDLSDVANLGGWLTTVAGRVCLDHLRARRARPEEPLEVPGRSELAVADEGADPEHEVVLAESVGAALLVVLDTLAPAERLAFVLHDMFAVPFDEIARIVGRTPAATKMLASRARRRVRTAGIAAETNVRRQRAVVEAFLAASRQGDFDALLALLDPDAVARADAAAASADRPVEVRGAQAVARQALAFSQRARSARVALVDGTVGIVVARGAEVLTILTFAIVDGRIAEVRIRADPERLRAMNVVALDEPGVGG